MDWDINTVKRGLKGEIRVPSDKSISHRAIMFSAISKGSCRIDNFLFSGDCMSTLEAFRSMGTEIKVNEDSVTVKGKGLKGLMPPEGNLYLGNSGTTMRIISGILAAQDFNTVLTGDESLSMRPMGRIIDPLTLMGADIKPAPGSDHAPLNITGSKAPLESIEYVLPVPSAQVKSCVLSAGLYAEGKTTVLEKIPSRDHTERMLEYFSAHIIKEGLRTELTGLNELEPKDIVIPGDISSAAFFIVAALIVKDSTILIRNVGLNPTRTGSIDVLKRMGGNIKIADLKESMEPSGDIEIRTSELKGTIVEEHEIPLLIDEIPVIALAAAFATGETIIKGIKELKVKETDRVKSIMDNLQRAGIHIKEENNSLIVRGGSEILEKAEFDSFGDHRIAMTMAIAALLSNGESKIKNTDCVDTSYPGFIQDLNRIKH